MLFINIKTNPLRINFMDDESKMWLKRDDVQLKWLRGDIARRKLPILEPIEGTSLEDEFLYLSEYLLTIPQLKQTIKNAWRQEKYRHGLIEKGLITRKVIMSKQANGALLSLAKDNPIDTTLEKIILDEYKYEIEQVRLDKLLRNEINLSKKQAQARTSQSKLLQEKLTGLKSNRVMANDVERLNKEAERLATLSLERKIKLSETAKELKKKNNEILELKAQLSATKNLLSRFNKHA